MRRVFVFLLVLFPFSCFAKCVSADQVTKCARLPEFLGRNIDSVPGDYTKDSWSFIYKTTYDGEFKHYYSGTSAEIITNGDEQFLYCYMTSPFQMTIIAGYSLLPTSNLYEACSRYLPWAITRSLSNVTVAAVDVCPDGFYTVPYEIDCGEGFVDVADVAHCDEDTSGDFCLIGGVLIAPCAAGITTLRTGTGVSIPLWAEKSTQPSLCVKYNDNICYANLEAGQATNAINVNYDGVVYHTVD
ncbi:MAG: hypothetical protein R8M37_00230 [Alphaproteobacteria bacterium]|nr:hypothetical protein [Alphaproteobacteria bacterium]